MPEPSPAPPIRRAVIPRATYRLQLHHAFTFADATAVLPYLQRLGVSHVYCSPILRARPGSMHGYDVVAPNEISPELGGDDGFERFARAAREHGLGLLVDVVPNHMAIGDGNPWWTDVLTHGPASAYARHFDIDWQPRDPALAGRVLLPVLGDGVGRVLQARQLTLEFDAAHGRFALRYFEHAFPVDPRTVAPLLRAAAACPTLGGDECAALDELGAAFDALPARDAEAAPSGGRTRAERAQPLHARLSTLAGGSSAVARAIAAVAQRTANDPDALEALHDAQAYRLAHWRVASDEINYRRFFDIDDLAAVRVEDEAVFEATQGRVLDLAAAGWVDGLRIDHPDGLHAPGEYFGRLQHGYARRAGLGALPALDTDGRPPRPLYVVAEKIAAAHESLPERWAVHGTTGYRFANVVVGVLIDAGAREAVDRLWRRHSGELRPFEAIAHEGKQLVMHTALASELTVLATELLRIARAHRLTRDHTHNALRRALAEVAACMPVYRTYIVAEPSDQDQRFIDWAVGQARRNRRAEDASVLDFVRAVLLAQPVDGADDALARRVLAFARRFQQFSSPVSAKGVEDTAFYRYVRFVALNEVGGDPGVFGLSVRGFHAASADRAARWPHTILATSTHDHKRSEDVRCRLAVLSEMPAAWRLLLRRFTQSRQLRRWRDASGDSASGAPARAAAEAASAEPMPSRTDEYLLLQTLLGTLPADGLDDASLPAYRDRIEAYMLKAVREAKLHTSWLNPDPAYEDALAATVRAVLARVRPNPLLTAVQSLATRLAWFGALNALSMVTLKLTSPGVPDLYQGHELIELTLVDPDNRRPVDFGLRSAWLAEQQALAAHATRAGRPFDLAALTATPTDGRLKLWVTWRLLQLRRERPALFRDGGYAPLAVRCTAEDDPVVAFEREAAGERVIVLAARLHARRLAGQPGWPVGPAVWRDAVLELPALADGTRLHDRLSGRMLTVHDGVVRLAEALQALPVAVFEVGGGATAAAGERRD